jgi:hypothetical protein
MLPITSRLNSNFGADGIAALVARRHSFAGASFDTAMASLVDSPGTPLHEVFLGFLRALPPTIHDTYKAVVHSALHGEPPTLITFAWAPGYDYELTQWYVPEPEPEMPGVTLLLRTRYPEDPHPTTGAQAVAG